jgi:hypothetical protein
MYGGPTRWCFDHFLRPYDDNVYYDHPMIFNKISNSKYAQQYSYETFKHNSINLPLLWKNKIPTKGNSNIEMSSLLDNMLSVRGVHLEGSFGHPLNCSKMIAPIVGGLSLDGLIGDLSTTAFGAISVGNTPVTRAFKSRKSTISKIPTNEKNYLEYLLRPFVYEKSLLKGQNKEIDAAINDAIDSLKLSSSKHVLHRDLFKARKFLRTSIEGLIENYDDLVKKYELLIQKALKSKILNVNDQNILGAKFPIEMNGDVDVEKIYGHFKYDDVFLCDSDIREVMNNATVGEMAQNFALSEYVIVNGLSSSILISDKSEIGSMFEGVKSRKCVSDKLIKKVFNKKTNKTVLSVDEESYTPRQSKVTFDPHSIGSVLTFLTSSTYFYILSTCLNELVSEIKKHNIEGVNLFDETLIHIASEYDREPLLDLKGSAHNEKAHVSSFLSGIIKGQEVLGNIYTGLDKNEKEWGTQGNSAPVEALNGERIGISNLSSTISEMLRAPAIVKRSPSIVEVKNNKVHSKIERARNIEGSYVENFDA